MVENKLLKAGADPNAEEIPLCAASFNGHSRVCSLLLEGGANLNRLSVDDEGTALSNAVTRGHRDVALLVLMEHGASFNDETLTPAMLKDLNKWMAEALKEKNRQMEEICCRGSPSGVPRLPLPFWPMRGIRMTEAAAVSPMLIRSSLPEALEGSARRPRRQSRDACGDNEALDILSTYVSQHHDASFSWSPSVMVRINNFCSSLSFSSSYPRHHTSSSASPSSASSTDYSVSGDLGGGSRKAVYNLQTWNRCDA